MEDGARRDPFLSIRTASQGLGADGRKVGKFCATDLNLSRRPFPPKTWLWNDLHARRGRGGGGIRRADRAGICDIWKYFGISADKVVRCTYNVWVREKGEGRREVVGCWDERGRAGAGVPRFAWRGAAGDGVCAVHAPFFRKSGAKWCDGSGMDVGGLCHAAGSPRGSRADVAPLLRNVARHWGAST